MNSQKSALPGLIVLVIVVGVAGGIVWSIRSSDPNIVSTDGAGSAFVENTFDPRVEQFGELQLWWDGIAADAQAASFPTDSRSSNIHPRDYAGPDTCHRCHRKNYEAWSQHPHRWMNALATDETVKGDFSGKASIEYMGGVATFGRDSTSRTMTLERDGVARTYDIRKTIGSRFFQYYIGRLVDGPEPESHVLRHTNHVLPFGYWIDPAEWVPVVHVFNEGPDIGRHDPFEVLAEPKAERDYFEYSTSCSGCHTTFPLGDDLIRKTATLSRHATGTAHWYAGAYFASAHPDLMSASGLGSDQELNERTEEFRQREPEDHGVSFGISCEACHLGCQEHVDDQKRKPDFYPRSPLLRVVSANQVEEGRTHQNVNRACSRCHAAQRSEYANGSATWNSVEYEDAMKGSCYSQLKCIDCHDPHQATGPVWTRTADQDDQSCIRCHDQFSTDEAITAHTHHPVGTAGSRCMNCHMPRINEGLQDVVRTHTIFSPTNSQMIESNHLNACNMCHTDQPIDWTLQHLQEWYGRDYDGSQITDAYPDRDGPAAVGWLDSDSAGVRLVAADAIARARDQSALSQLIDALDDPFLTNRQFARIGLEQMLDIQLSDFGYRFYMMKDERKAPLQRLREHLLSESDE